MRPFYPKIHRTVGWFQSVVVACALSSFHIPVMAFGLQPDSSRPASYGDAYFSAQQQEPKSHVIGSRSMLASTGSVGKEPLPGKPFAPGEVVAIVGTEPILVGDMLLQVNQFLLEQLPGAPQQVRDQQQRAVIKMLAGRFVDARMMFQDGISGLPDGADVESILKQVEVDFDEKALPLMMKKSGIDSTTVYDAHLRALGGSLSQLRRSWAREQLGQHFALQKIKVNENISHAEMYTYYMENLDSYKHESTARWEELMVVTAGKTDRLAAARKLEEMGNKVLYGASFQKIAQEMSEGLTARNGGQYDWTTRGSLSSRELDEAIFTIPLNELSDVIVTDYGLHIIRVLERKEACTTPFLDAQSEIRKSLLESRREAALKKHIETLRKKIPHEIVFETE